MNHKGVRIRDHKSEINLFRNRVIVAFIGIFIFTFVLVGNLYRLQVENFESYQTRADGNRIKVLPIAPTRGLIYDRNGVLLAENQLVFDLGIDRISTWMNRFDFGKPTGIDIYEESNANMLTRDWKMMRYHTPWYQGDTVPIGIGQGYWTDLLQSDWTLN